jgi:HEPN domain-containing protein
MVLGPQAGLCEGREGDSRLNFRDLAKGYLRQAEARRDDAVGALADGNHAYALRLSQECVELCVKAALRFVGVEYPKQHEVSGLLVDLKARFPEWFAAEVPFIREASVSLFKKRELAFYGGEDIALPPDSVIDKDDGRKAVEAAERVFAACERLMAGHVPATEPRR